MHIRPLARDEIEHIWTIDRTEVIEHIYSIQEGALVLQPGSFHLHGWPPGEAEQYTPLLYACYDRYGSFWGCFAADQLIGVAILDTKWLGPDGDLLQLKFLHVSHTYRKQGVGTALFERARVRARARSAKGLYISATPSENTIEFYCRLGAVVTSEPDPELYALEPKDIHLVCPV